MKLFDVRSTIALLFATIFVCKSAHWWETNPYGGWRVYGGVYRYARHIQDCTLRCFMKYNSKCKAISFNTRTLGCMMESASRIHVVRGSKDETLVIHNTTTLEALFVGHGHASRYYSFDYNQAYDICKIFSGQLMNGTELENRFNNGEDMCQCGWTMDGTPMYSNQAGNVSSCGGDPGVFACNSTLAHAWCTMLN